MLMRYNISFPSYHLILMNTLFLTNTFFFTIFFCMDDANFTYHPSLIMYYSSTHFLILFFSLTHFPPLWMVDAMFIFILVFISSYFRSVWHPFSCFILRMVYFVLFCVTSLGPTHFPSCSSHTVNTFFL